MKPLRLVCSWILLLGLVPPASVDAEVDRVRIKVEKKEKTSRGKSEEDPKNFVQLTEKLSYHIEIHNFSSLSISNATVKWVMWFQPRGKMKLEFYSGGSRSTSWPSSGPKTVRGESKCTLGPGKRYEFDTDEVELGIVISNQEQKARDYQRGGGDALGYLVEVYADEQLIGSKAVPSDIKKRLKLD